MSEPVQPTSPSLFDAVTPARSSRRPPSPLVMTVEEAAMILGISRGLAYELVRRGELPAIRLGRRLVVPRRKLLALVDGPEV